jgi:hypothetical protein
LKVAVFVRSKSSIEKMWAVDSGGLASNMFMDDERDLSRRQRLTEIVAERSADGQVFAISTGVNHELSFGPNSNDRLRSYRVDDQAREHRPHEDEPRVHGVTMHFFVLRRKPDASKTELV